MSNLIETRQPTVVARLSGVEKRYGDVQALAGLDLHLQVGEVLALLGPNGAGKSTTVSLLLGGIRPDAGQVHVFDGDPKARAQRVRIGAMLQTAGLPPTLEVLELVDLFRSYYPWPMAIGRLVEMAGIGDLLERRYGALSGGEKQRLHFALALAGNPDLLFLDEPSAGLDVAARRGLWKVVRRAASDGRTVLLTTHHLEEADALADRVVVLHRGRSIANGSPAQIKARVSEQVITCITRLDEAALGELPGVKAVRQRGTSMEILTASAVPLLRRLLELDAELDELEVKGVGLEQAFLSLTEEQSQVPEGTDSPRQEGVAA